MRVTPPRMHREERWSKVENKRAQRKGNKQKQSGNNTSDGLEREWSELIAKDTAAVTLVCKAQGLLGHEVSNHGGRGRKRRGTLTFSLKHFHPHAFIHKVVGMWEY